MPTLLYIYDPQCGWCYGAAPLVAAANQVKNLKLELRAGGLWPQPTHLPTDMRGYIQQADQRIGQISGQKYGDAYLNGLLLDPEMICDSRPTTAAILAAAALKADAALPMLNAIQHAHYVDGLHVVRSDVLCNLAESIGLQRDEFIEKMNSVDPSTHIESTRQLMQQIGAQGFPTFVLEIDGELRSVPHNQFAGDAAGFAAWLAQAVQL